MISLPAILGSTSNTRCTDGQIAAFSASEVSADERPNSSVSMSKFDTDRIYILHYHHTVADCIRSSTAPINRPAIIVLEAI